jgi:glycosyltransferase involved in cell wall biosynthesis
MKILYTTEYKGNKIDGVWTRVRNESEWMKKHGHEVFICAAEDCRPKYRLSDNASVWDFKKLRKIIWNYHPDIIICNTYRHLETNECVLIAKAMNIPCILVTHAPFLESGIRNKLLSFATKIYDKIFGLEGYSCDFSKIFAISNWEMPYLHKLGADKSRIQYVPNAIPDELFTACVNEKRMQTKTKLLFLGRVAPVKDIPTLLKAMSLLDKDKYSLTIAGPFEKEYRDFLVQGMKELGILDYDISFIGSIDNLKDKIELIDKHNIFVLPSLREGMPQTLLEFMARGKIVISSRNQGALEIIKDGNNGLLFDIGNEKQLAEKISMTEDLSYSDLDFISSNARKTAEQFKASKIYPETEKIYLSLLKSSTQKPKSI